MKLIRLSLALTAALIAACSGAPGQSGQNGKDGTQGEPGADGTTPEATKAAMTVNHITPRAGLLDRTLDVVVSFDGPRADLAGAKLDFGDGIEVKGTKVVNGTIVASLVVAPDAKLGAHDVTVKLAAGDPIVATKGFHVAVPIDARVAAGKAEQGGLVRVDVSNRDKVWFDTENFLLLPLVDQKTPSLVPLANQGFTATDGSVVFLGDPLAKPGKLGFLGINNPNDPDSVSFLSEADAVNVTARTPVPLAAGTPLEATFTNELETGFFVADVAAPAVNTEGLLLDIVANVPDGSDATPMLLAYPASGTVADLIDQKVEDPGFPMFGIPATKAHITFPITGATKSYFVVLDANLGHGPNTKVSLSYSTVRAQVFKEKTDAHDTPDKAQNLGSLPNTTTTVAGRIISGELKSAGESDFFKFTGLSAVNVTDMQISLTSDADVLVRVDTVPTFDSENLVEIVQGGKGGSGFTTAMTGTTRYVQVTALPDSSKQTGKYTLGMKRVVH